MEGGLGILCDGAVLVFDNCRCPVFQNHDTNFESESFNSWQEGDHQENETECKRSVHVVEPTTLPHNTDKSDISQTTNLLGYKKTSKMVSPPNLATAKNVVDVVKVVKEVIPRHTNFLRPLLYTY
jgi:hypothetical protein